MESIERQNQIIENMEVFINNGINNMVSRMSDHIINCLADKYGFDKEEAIRAVYSDNENNEKEIENNEKKIESNIKPMTIDELEVPQEPIIEAQAPKKKGRPKKSAVVSDTAAAAETSSPKKKSAKKQSPVPDNEQAPIVTEVPKKKRGRPKKEAPKAEAIVSDDYENTNAPTLVTNLLNAVRGGELSPDNATTNIHNYYTESTITETEQVVETKEAVETEQVVEPEQVVEVEETDEIEENDEIEEAEYTKNVTSIIIHGTEYYIDDDNKLYDPDTTELIGKYNRDNDSVIN